MSLNGNEIFLPQNSMLLFNRAAQTTTLLLCVLCYCAVYCENNARMHLQIGRARNLSNGPPAPELNFPSGLVRGASDRYRDTQCSLIHMRMCEFRVHALSRSSASERTQ
jgi:hypothetical protein